MTVTKYEEDVPQVKEEKPKEYAWEIRKNKVVYLGSNIEKCGYDKKTLTSMKKAGYVLYKDGKVYKEI